MGRILYFNPENDLALAAADPHYTPPASALQMATDLQRLPLRWAEADDLVLLRDGTFIDAQGQAVSLANDSFLQPSPDPLSAPPSGEDGHLSRKEGNMQNIPFSPEGGAERGSVTCLPWGWSPLVVTEFQRAGVPPSMLPSDDEMQAFRTLSGRATAADVLCRLHERLASGGYAPSVVGEAHVCHTMEEARQWHGLWGDTMFKQPWSGSGRGLLPAHNGELTSKNEAWIARTLRLQGYLMAEPLYERRHDFALEFWRHADGSVTFEGLSLFMTTAGGVYAGNIIDSEEGKRRRLAHWVDLQLIDVLTAMLVDELASLPPTFYEGPVGVDMLVTADGRIHPCVEINFRMTMGWLALHISPFFE